MPESGKPGMPGMLLKLPLCFSALSSIESLCHIPLTGSGWAEFGGIYEPTSMFCHLWNSYFHVWSLQHQSTQ